MRDEKKTTMEEHKDEKYMLDLSKNCAHNLLKISEGK